MATGQPGYQPRNTPAERRAFFDLQRQLRESGGSPDWAEGYPTYDPRYVNVDGDTMIGDLVLAADPDAAMEAATKQYVDGQVATRLTQAQVDARVTAVGDPLYVDVAGDTMSGGLTAPNFIHSAAQSANVAAATRKDYVDGQVATRLTQAQVDARVTAVGDPRYVNDSGDTMTGTLTVGSGNNRGDYGGGNVFLVRDNASAWPLNIRHADSSTTTIFIIFQYGGTTIGSIIRNGSNNGVAYQTTSHGPWKDVLGPITDDEALEIIARYRPVHYRWKYDAEGRISSSGVGDESEPPQRGFVAEDHTDVAPWAVTPAIGEEGDEMFQPGGMDYGRITPDLVAAVQALTHKVEALTARVAELEGVSG